MFVVVRLFHLWKETHSSQISPKEWRNKRVKLHLVFLLLPSVDWKANCSGARFIFQKQKRYVSSRGKRAGSRVVCVCEYTYIYIGVSLSIIHLDEAY